MLENQAGPEFSMLKSCFPELYGGETLIVLCCEIVEVTGYWAGNSAAVEFKCCFSACTLVFNTCNPRHNIGTSST